MKIGILTLPLHTNYGGILQAYALQTVLVSLGHEVILLNKERVPQLTGLKKIIVQSSRFIKKYIFRMKQVNIHWEEQCLTKYKVLSYKTQQFIDKYINNALNDKLSSIREAQYNLDVIVVGSDQIWRPVYIGNTLRDTVKNAYLGFTEGWNIKRISYAASFGTEDWEYSQKETELVRKLIKKFNAVSVREESGVRLCKEHFSVDAIHVLDPTMLLDKDAYELLIDSNDKVIHHKGVFMNYILEKNEQTDSLINRISKQKGLEPYSMNISDVADGILMQDYVEQWLCGFSDADFIVTDSFHACVFSILFRKPFVVLGNKNRGYSRFLSLMRMFGLEDNLISNVDEYDANKSYEIPMCTYDYLEDLREQSLQYLKISLE